MRPHCVSSSRAGQQMPCCQHPPRSCPYLHPRAGPPRCRARAACASAAAPAPSGRPGWANWRSAPHCTGRGTCKTTKATVTVPWGCSLGQLAGVAALGSLLTEGHMAVPCGPCPISPRLSLCVRSYAALPRPAAHLLSPRPARGSRWPGTLGEISRKDEKQGLLMLQHPGIAVLPS